MKSKSRPNTFSLIRRVFSLCVHMLPGVVAAYSLSLLFAGIMNGATVVVSRALFDSIELTAGQSELLHATIYSLLIYISAKLLCQLAGWVKEYISMKAESRLDIALDGMFHEKLAGLPAIDFEDKARLDRIERASSGANCVPALLCAFLSILCYHLIYFVILGVFLYRIEPMLAAAILLVFVPVAISQFVQVRYYTDEEEKLAPLRRAEDSYYYSAMDTRETRLFGLFHHFKNLRLEAMKQLFTVQWDTQRKLCLVQFLLNIVKVFGWIGILTLLYMSLKSGRITVGAFAAVFTSIGTMFAMTEELFGVYHSGITANIGAVANFLDLTDTAEPQKQSTETDGADGIRLSHVTFSYPAADVPAVKDVSLAINPGESIAIVGENGSGKTTLSKLICGLYTPDEGSVVIDGIDTRYAERNCIFRKFSAVFQKYNEYGALTLRDNVKISDFDSGNDTGICFASAEIDVSDNETFPHGQDTYMSREFDGVDVSKGQWQRIAMARGDYRDAKYFLLDEPTAAIDPFEEARVYKKYAEVAHNVTTIFITHRMASTRFADTIIVMDHGEIVEQGTHETLLQNGGKYAELWTAQADGYNS